MMILRQVIMNVITLFIVLCTAVIHFNTATESKDVLIVTTVLNEPYVMISGKHKRESIPNRSEITGDLLEGYVIDLLKIIAKKAEFNYTIRLVKDGAYGYKSNGKWNGMLGEVIRGEADLAIADLTITSAREQVVDFSYPFMTTSIGLLAKRPPYYSCEANASASISYNCNVRLYPVNGIDDLPHQNAVKYAAINSGSTYSFFRNSNDALYAMIGETMQTTKSVTDGINRVKSSNGDFVFLMEGAAIEYLTARNCDLMQLGSLVPLAKKGYGLAMKHNYYLRTEINMALLEMQETGVLDELKKKWFLKPKICNNRLDSVYAKNALNLVLSSLN